MTIPTPYLALISSLPATEVSFGAGGIRLLTAGEFEEGQVGYSVDPDGSSLCGEAIGEWKSSWLVIGFETGVGDPVLVDTSDPKLAVLSAMHGEGAWDPRPVAISIEAFGKIFLEFRRIAEGQIRSKRKTIQCQLLNRMRSCRSSRRLTRVGLRLSSGTTSLLTCVIEPSR